jgi:hypothetical protein
VSGRRLRRWGGAEAGAWAVVWEAGGVTGETTTRWVRVGGYADFG